MSPLTTEILGSDRTILVMRLPSTVADEQVTLIREEFRSRMPRQLGAGLVLDFTAVELINSIGITCLLQLEEDCRRMKAPMLLASLPPMIAQFLRQLKLDRRFVALTAVDDAVARIESDAAAH